MPIITFSVEVDQNGPVEGAECVRPADELAGVGDLELPVLLDRVLVGDGLRVPARVAHAGAVRAVVALDERLVEHKPLVRLVI